MSTVLCVGGESLHIRQLLLKNAGFQVITATTVYDTERHDMRRFRDKLCNRG